jgi:hypothetical protein
VRLSFTLPPGWREHVHDDVVRLVAGDEPGLLVEAGPLVGMESFRPSDLIGRAAGKVEIVETQKGLETETGWPMELVRVHVLDAAGAPTEVRLAAVYVMAYYGGLAVARVAPARFEAVRDALVQILTSARPRYRDVEPVTIAELFEMTP